MLPFQRPCKAKREREKVRCVLASIGECIDVQLSLLHERWLGGLTMYPCRWGHGCCGVRRGRRENGLVVADEFSRRQEAQCKIFRSNLLEIIVFQSFDAVHRETIPAIAPAATTWYRCPYFTISFWLFTDSKLVENTSSFKCSPPADIHQ